MAVRKESLQHSGRGAARARPWPAAARAADAGAARPDGIRGALASVHAAGEHRPERASEASGQVKG